MSEFLTWELQFLIKSLFMGLFLRSLYDIIIVLRRLISHGIIWTAAEDFLYWVGCALCIFTLFYYENDGAPRGFAAAAVVGGMVLYHLGPSRFVCLVLEWLIHMILMPIAVPVKFFVKICRKLLKRKKKSDRIVLDSSVKGNARETDSVQM